MTPIRVLVADDEAMARKRMVRLASALPGVDVIGTAEDGRQVLDFIAEEPVDLVLLDIQMPEMDGTEVTKRIREGAGSQPFILAHTANALPAQQEAYRDAGVDGVLAKPASLAELKSAVEGALATRHDAARRTS